MSGCEKCSLDVLSIKLIDVIKIIIFIEKLLKKCVEEICKTKDLNAFIFISATGMLYACWDFNFFSTVLTPPTLSFFSFSLCCVATFSLSFLLSLYLFLSHFFSIILFLLTSYFLISLKWSNL
jgi:hypothetical protein